MTVYEIKVRIYLQKNIKVMDMQENITHFLDSFLQKHETFAKYHESKIPKCYTMDLPYPIEKGMSEYKGDNLYQFRIRTVDEELSAYFVSGIADHKTENIKGLSRTVKAIPHRHISSVYTLTPVVLTDAKGRGYWRDTMSFTEFEEMLKKSMIDQYEKYTGETIDQDFPLYDQIEVKNKVPIGISYKGITLLGDKLSMQVADNKTAQKVAYFLLGSSIGTRGSRGMGFLGYRFL